MSRGKLGIIVIIIALTGTLIGAWVMSMDVNEVEVTKYRPLADISGEFETEKTPQYIEYNPSTNYTGYYTDDSIVNNVRYFDGVDYTSSTPNNYRLNLKPTSSYEGSKDLTQLAASNHGTLQYLWDNNSAFKVCTPYMLTIDDLITAWNYGSYDEVTILNNQSIDWSDPTDWVGFVPNNWIGQNYGSIINIKDPSLTPDLSGTYKSWTWNNPIVVCKYNAVSKTVELFYDAAMTQSAGIFSPSSVYIMWGDTGSYTFSLGTSVDVEAYDFPEPEYMDPSKGVNL